MKITIESTDLLTLVYNSRPVSDPMAPEPGGVPARVWEGHTESGIPVTVCITRILVKAEHDQAQFQKELKEVSRPASADTIEAIPLRFIL